jgi:hypothetical protein
VLWTEIQHALVEVCRTKFSAEAFRAEMEGVIADCGALPAQKTGAAG